MKCHIFPHRVLKNTWRLQEVTSQFLPGGSTNPLETAESKVKVASQNV